MQKFDAEAAVMAADRLRNSDCKHNVPGNVVDSAADCNRCLEEELCAAYRAGLKRAEEISRAQEPEFAHIKEALSLFGQDIADAIAREAEVEGT